MRHNINRHYLSIYLSIYRISHRIMILLWDLNKLQALIMDDNA